MFLMNRSHAVEIGGRNSIYHQRRVPILYKKVDNILLNILVARIYFILIITWSLAYGCGQQQNRIGKKNRQIDDDFNDHAVAVV